MSGDFDALIKSLAKAAGLSDEMAEDVINTAMDYVKAQHPDKAEQIDARLGDEKVAKRAGNLIGKLAGKSAPEDAPVESEDAERDEAE